ncbi:MAG: putative sulfate/molybdate transporter [Verrucomicrobiae bacterium]|nr:putative sulfate/molybdate transporter [Verrucomicrobiae bacterium]
MYGAGLAIGVVMLVLAATGLLEWLARVVPKCVVRGIQFGLGVQLVLLALRDYVRADGGWGCALAGVAFVVALALAGLFLSGGFEQFSHLFPRPMLGVLLVFEGWTLLTLLRDTVSAKSEFMIALLVGLTAGGLPYGYVVGLLVGTALYYLARGGTLRLGHD